MSVRSESALTIKDIRRLSAFKMRYRLVADGFTHQQAARLVFWRYLYQMRRETVAG